MTPGWNQTWIALVGGEGCHRCAIPAPPVTNYADLAREREHHLTTACTKQIPKYSQIRTESKLFRMPSSRHLTLSSCC